MINRRFVLDRSGLACQRRHSAAYHASPRHSIRNNQRCGIRVEPGGPDDQTIKLNALLTKASSSGQQIFLPPGAYIVSGLQFPAYVNLLGVSGKSRLLFGGKSGLIRANGADHIQLNGLVIDGDGRPLGDSVRGLFEASNVAHLVLMIARLSGRARMPWTFSNAVDVSRGRVFPAPAMRLYLLRTPPDCRSRGNEIQRLRQWRHSRSALRARPRRHDHYGKPH